jgi:hypothetical protein
MDLHEPITGRNLEARLLNTDLTKDFQVKFLERMKRRAFSVQLDENLIIPCSIAGECCPGGNGDW